MESLICSLTIGLTVFYLFYSILLKPNSNANKLRFPHGPIVFLRLGSVPTVVVSSPAMAKEFLKTHDSDLLAAGIETSSTTVEWAMTELLRNPATLARAHKEIESAVGRDRRVKEGDVMGFDYLRLVVKETFRLHPPLPLLIPHESMEGCSVGGYFVPPKTRLFVNLWAMGRDENVWKDAHEFKPERFMGSSKDVRGKDFDLLPFGTGRRGCPGMTMGISVVELALAQLLHCFDWTVEGEVDVMEEFGLTVPKKNPLFARPSWRLTAEYPI